MKFGKEYYYIEIDEKTSFFVLDYKEVEKITQNLEE